MSTPYLAAPLVQSAIYGVLSEDPTLQTMLSGVFDGDAPEGTAYPFVLVGDATETQDNTHGVFGRQSVQTLHVWSDYAGFAEVNAIAGVIVGLLDHQPLSVVSVRHVSTRFEFAQALVDPDRPYLRHMPMRFRVITSKG